MTNDDYIRYVEELERLVAQQGWNLTKHYRSSWCSFSRPNQNNVAFGIMLGTQNELYLYIKRVHANAGTFSIRAANYSPEWDQDEYLLEPDVTKLSAFLPLLKLAYSRI